MPLHQCIISVSLYPVVLSVYPKYHGCKHTLLCQVLSFMLLQSLSPHVTLGRLLHLSDLHILKGWLGGQIQPHVKAPSSDLAWSRGLDVGFRPSFLLEVQGPELGGY